MTIEKLDKTNKFQIPKVLKQIIPTLANLLKATTFAGLISLVNVGNALSPSMAEIDSPSKTNISAQEAGENPMIIINIAEPLPIEKVEEIVRSAIGKRALPPGSNVGVIISQGQKNILEDQLKIVGDPTDNTPNSNNQLEKLTELVYRTANKVAVQQILAKTETSKTQEMSLSTYSINLESEKFTKSFKDLYNDYFALADLAEIAKENSLMKLILSPKTKKFEKTNSPIKVDVSTLIEKDKNLKSKLIETLRTEFNLQEFNLGKTKFKLRDEAILKFFGLKENKGELDFEKVKKLLKSLSDPNQTNDIKWEVYNNLSQNLAKTLTKEGLSQKEEGRVNTVINQLQIQTKWNFVKNTRIAVEKLEKANSMWIMPVFGELTSTYGKRIDPITGEESFHSGVDFATPEGTPVMAVNSGTIIFAGDAGGYGNRVEIRHDNGIITTYSHLQSIGVIEGQKVSKGTQIAFSGNTGRSTGPHLHFEVGTRNPNGELITVDPQPYLANSTQNQVAKVNFSDLSIQEILAGQPVKTAPQMP